MLDDLCCLLCLVVWVWGDLACGCVLGYVCLVLVGFLLVLYVCLCLIWYNI